MALSTCPKAGCDSHRFELVEADIQKARYRMFFVRCERCGAVIGTEPYQNTNVLVEKAQNQLKEVASKIASLTTVVAKLAKRQP